MNVKFRVFLLFSNVKKFVTLHHITFKNNFFLLANCSLPFLPLQTCGCPLYWKSLMFYSAGGERTGFVSVHSFVATWRKWEASLARSSHHEFFWRRPAELFIFVFVRLSLLSAGCCTVVMTTRRGSFTSLPSLAAATLSRRTSSLCCRWAQRKSQSGDSSWADEKWACFCGPLIYCIQFKLGLSV